MEFITKTDQETKELGKKLATELSDGDIICLYGELGAGKTTLVKGIAEGLGITEDVVSPTFTLMSVYEEGKRKKGKGEREKVKGKRLVHIDTYRLKDEQELVDIGAEDYLGAPDTVTIIEWPEKIEKLLKNKKIRKITLEHLENGGRKIITDIT